MTKALYSLVALCLLAVSYRACTHYGTGVVALNTPSGREAVQVAEVKLEVSADASTANIVQEELVIVVAPLVVTETVGGVELPATLKGTATLGTNNTWELNIALKPRVVYRKKDNLFRLGVSLDTRLEKDIGIILNNPFRNILPLDIMFGLSTVNIGYTWEWTRYTMVRFGSAWYYTGEGMVLFIGLGVEI